MGIAPRKLRFYGPRDLDRLPPLQSVPRAVRRDMRAVAQVLPFRVNDYVLDELIDWDAVPADPIFQLTFPQPGMLEPEELRAVREAMERQPTELPAVVERIRGALNPHPAGQATLNVPVVDEEPVPGVQRKYRETCLLFPAKGQTCHAYCTFCFRWPQFVGHGHKFATEGRRADVEFVRREKDLTDVLVTGGDPLIMGTSRLAEFVEPFLGPGFEHIQTLRIGTKSISYWPHRFVTDADADALLALFERIVDSGKHLAVMAHVNHGRELATPVAEEAIRRIRSTGAQIRTQSPLIRHINDASDVWADLWSRQVRLGCIPYYMFVERDTGAHRYFGLPLLDAYEIFHDALTRVSGLARTVRGPSMSATPGKVRIDGVTEIRGEKVFVLSFLQARNPDWCKRPFFAVFDPRATWLEDLRPAFGEPRFFFEEDLERYRRERRQGDPRRRLALRS